MIKHKFYGIFSSFALMDLFSVPVSDNLFDSFHCRDGRNLFVFVWLEDCCHFVLDWAL